MKWYKYCIVILLTFGVTSWYPTPLQACNYSSLSIDNVTDNGDGTYTFDLTVCIGAGYEGPPGPTNTGGQDDTKKWSLVVSGGSATLDAWSSSVTCDNTGEAYEPSSSTNTQVVYDDPDGSEDCACIQDTCGSANSYCQSLTITTDGYPDEICAEGLEADGDLSSGCHDGDECQQPSTLPITLIDFTGAVQNQEIVLNWRTSTEQNNDYFRILRSLNGDQFRSIATIPGNGNSQTVQSYKYVDGIPSTGSFPYYYRLQQVDYDGTVHSYQTIAVSGSKTSNNKSLVLEKYRVLSNEVVKLHLYSPRPQKAVVHLYNLKGQRVDKARFQLVKGANTVNLSGISMKKGIYFVSVQGQEHNVTRKIFRVQH